MAHEPGEQAAGAGSFLSAALGPRFVCNRAGQRLFGRESRPRLRVNRLNSGCVDGRRLGMLSLSLADYATVRKPGYTINKDLTSILYVARRNP